MSLEMNKSIGLCQQCGKHKQLIYDKYKFVYELCSQECYESRSYWALIKRCKKGHTIDKMTKNIEFPDNLKDLILTFVQL